MPGIPHHPRDAAPGGIPSSGTCGFPAHFVWGRSEQQWNAAAASAAAATAAAATAATAAFPSHLVWESSEQQWQEEAAVTAACAALVETYTPTCCCCTCITSHLFSAWGAARALVEAQASSSDRSRCCCVVSLFG
jgi:hypothetical protein